MPPKRKRISSPSKSQKKTKTSETGKRQDQCASQHQSPSPSSQAKTKKPGRKQRSSSTFQHQHGEVDPEQFYTVRNILEEKKDRYLVDWEDGPDGQEYDPTWEPKGNVNEAAVQDWETIKAQTSKSGAPLSSDPPREKPGKAAGAEPPRKKRGRPRKQPVPRSSPVPETSAVTQDKEEDEDQEDIPELSVASTKKRLFKVHDSYLKPNPCETHESPSPRVRTASPPFQETQVHDEIEDFTSSQVISGTQPRLVEDPDISEPLLVDAAAAPNLTQKFSQYEPLDTSKTSEDTTASVVNTSSGTHSFAVFDHSASGVIIPDSQSVNDSTSYIPSLSRSDESSRPSNQIQGQSQIQPALASQRDHHTDSELVVPESSAAQAIQPHNVGDNLQEDNTTQSPRFETPLERNSIAHSPVVTADGGEAPNSPSSPASPAVAQTCSSTSSPPPTEFPDKSQSQSQSQSQFQQQSQWLSQSQSQANSDKHHQSDEQAAQRLEVFDFYTETVERSTESSLHFATQPLISLVTPGVEPDYPHLTAIVASARAASVPALQHPSLSSTFPSAPWQELSTPGDSAPVPPAIARSTRLFTPEPFSLPRSRSTTPMASSTPGSRRAGGGLRERMQAARAATQARAKSLVPASPKPASAVPARLQSPALQEREARSPSMVPPVEEVAEEPSEDRLRSERYETLLPGDDEPELAPFESLEPAKKTVNLHGIRSLPINFGVVQRDHYKQTVTWNKLLIDEFTSKVWPTDSTPAQKARKLLQELRDLVVHPDLINTEANSMQSQVEAEFKAQWDVDSSTKFRFLKHFFAASQAFDLSVVLLVQPGKLVQILQTFLRGNSVDFSMGSDDTESKPAATILTTDTVMMGIPRPDIILTLQGDISDELVASLQYSLSTLGSGTQIPAISLLVPKTVEHIERVMPSLPEAERLHVLMGTVTSLRGEAGKERSSIDVVEQAASRLVDFILDPSQWPFEELPSIRMFELVTMSQASTESMAEERSGDLSNGQGIKRVLSNGAEQVDGTKKAKTVHSSNGTADSHDDSHISDSVASQQAAAIKALKDDFARREKEMDTVLRKSKAQLEEHVKALETLQYGHEEQRQKLVQAESDRDKAIDTAKIAAARIASLETTISDVRNERSGLHNQLREAKESALNHAIPALAEYEKLREETAAAVVEQTRLLNKVKMADDNLDYVREQYQTASNSASALRKENTALEAQVLELGKKASGEQLKLRAKHLDDHSKNLAARNKKLELELKSREELLTRKEEEIIKLKESGRGRMNTRQSSVPRSPRIASPSSRQGSPAVGKGPHPLRNAG